VITTTSAAALAGGSASVSPGGSTGSSLLLTLVAGLIVGAGLLHLGRVVSYSVTIGLLNGVAVNSTAQGQSHQRRVVGAGHIISVVTTRRR
jgi:hypothetical protein